MQRREGGRRRFICCQFSFIDAACWFPATDEPPNLKSKRERIRSGVEDAENNLGSTNLASRWEEGWIVGEENVERIGIDNMGRKRQEQKNECSCKTLC